MTTLQKTIIGATLAAAIGTGVYEAHQASILRTQVQTLKQQQTPLAEQIQQLTGENSDLSNKLAMSDNSAVNKSFKWVSLESSDYGQYIANLRAIEAARSKRFATSSLPLHHVTPPRQNTSTTLNLFSPPPFLWG